MGGKKCESLSRLSLSLSLSLAVWRESPLINKIPREKISVPLHTLYHPNVIHFWQWTTLTNVKDMVDTETWKFLLEGVALPIVGVFGVTGLSPRSLIENLYCFKGNVLTARILLQKKLELSISFTQLLTALLFSDCVTILVTFVVFSLPKLVQVIKYSTQTLVPKERRFFVFFHLWKFQAILLF